MTGNSETVADGVVPAQDRGERRGTAITEQTAFGTELRRLRTAAGLSLTRLAQLVHYSKGYLSKVETGVAHPNHTLAVLCDAQLGTGGTLVALVPRLRRHSPRSVAKPFGLPRSTPHFTGREEALQWVVDVLRGPGLCVVDGMAGVGKTALAVAAGHRVAAHFPDGCVYVALRGFSPRREPMSSGEALDTLLRALDVPDEDIPADHAGRVHVYRSIVRGKRFLVVLDNARSADQVLPLLPADAGCAVVVTSRNRLVALDDAEHVSLPLLPEPDCVELFRSVSGHEHADATGVVRRCGRLPLAVRIAAARLRANPAWRVADLERSLSVELGRLDELDDGERSVAAAFRISLHALLPDQRVMFGLLALAPGDDVDLPAAAVLADVSVARAGRCLERLHESHLLVQERADRYRMHDLVREFALTAERSDATEAISRLADHHLHALMRADHLLTPQRFRPDVAVPEPGVVRDLADRAAALAWLDAEWPNLVALCEALGRDERCWRVAFFLREYFFHRRLCDPWVATHEHALKALRDNGWPNAATRANLAMARLNRGEPEAAMAEFVEARELFAALGDEHGVMNAVVGGAWVHHYLGEHDAALADLRTALDFYEGAGAARNAAITLRGIALMQIELGDFAASGRNARAALAAFRELGLDNDAAMALNCLGWNHFRVGEHAAAADAYRLARDTAAQCGSAFEEARAERGLGDVAAAAADVAAAERHWARARRLHPALETG